MVVFAILAVVGVWILVMCVKDEKGTNTDHRSATPYNRATTSTSVPKSSDAKTGTTVDPASSSPIQHGIESELYEPRWSEFQEQIRLRAGMTDQEFSVVEKYVPRRPWTTADWTLDDEVDWAITAYVQHELFDAASAHGCDVETTVLFADSGVAMKDWLSWSLLFDQAYRRQQRRRVGTFQVSNPCERAAAWAAAGFTPEEARKWVGWQAEHDPFADAHQAVRLAARFREAGFEDRHDADRWLQENGYHLDHCNRIEADLHGYSVAQTYRVLPEVLKACEAGGIAIDFVVGRPDGVMNRPLRAAVVRICLSHIPAPYVVDVHESPAVTVKFDTGRLTGWSVRSLPTLEAPEHGANGSHEQ